MPIFILYFLAAGAASVGGPAIGAVLYRRGQQAAAEHERAAEIAAVRRLLLAEMDLQELRAHAIRAGVDPDAVAGGYRALRDGVLTVEQVCAQIDAGAVR